MADIIDIANERAAIYEKAALSQRKPEGPDATGECLNCEAPLAPGVRWCDQHCRDDWQLNQRSK